MKKQALLSGLLIFSGILLNAQCSVQDSNIYKFTYNGHSYEIIKENKTWVQAAACAVTRGGYLMEIGSQAENDTLAYYISQASITNSNTVAPDGGGASYIWLGGSDLVSESKWQWDGDNDGTGTLFWLGLANGAPVAGAYTNWGNEPDDFNGQDALGYALTNWPLGVAEQWNDVKETNLLYFVVEYNSVSSINENGTGMINVYPNPSQEKIIIENDLNNQIKEIRLVDVTGKTVKSITDNLASKKINVNISDMSKGIYFVDIKATNGNVVKKIVID